MCLDPCRRAQDDGENIVLLRPAGDPVNTGIRRQGSLAATAGASDFSSRLRVFVHESESLCVRRR